MATDYVHMTQQGDGWIAEVGCYIQEDGRECKAWFAAGRPTEEEARSAVLQALQSHRQTCHE